MNATSLAALAARLGGSVALSLSQVPNPLTNLATDGAVPIQSALYSITKGSAIALTVAAPGAAGIGTRITFVTATDFQHVVTFTGTTLGDGTTGLNTTWTATAFAGCGLTVVAVSATRWMVESFNLGTIAP